MGTINNLYTIGWYGTCDSQPCVDYDLNPGVGDNGNIEAIYRVNTTTNTNGYETFLSSQYGTGLNTFETLQCGNAYLIKLLPSTSGVTIADFIVSSTSVDDGYIATDCTTGGEGGEVTPTPTATQPVPTPTATQPAPTPTATLPPEPTPTATQPAPTPTATQPAPTPTATQPAPTPTATAVPTLVTTIGDPSYSGGSTVDRTDDVIQLTVQVNIADRADGYQIFINDEAAPRLSQPIWTDIETATQFTTPSINVGDLSANTVHTVYAKPIFSDGSSAGPASVTKQFATVTVTPTNTPVLVTTLHNVTLTGQNTVERDETLTYEISVNIAGRANGYKVYVDDTNTPIETVTNSSDIATTNQFAATTIDCKDFLIDSQHTLIVVPTLDGVDLTSATAQTNFTVATIVPTPTPVPDLLTTIDAGTVQLTGTDTTSRDEAVNFQVSVNIANRADGLKYFVNGTATTHTQDVSTGINTTNSVQITGLDVSGITLGDEATIHVIPTLNGIETGGVSNSVTVTVTSVVPKEDIVTNNSSVNSQSTCGSDNQTSPGTTDQFQMTSNNTGDSLLQLRLTNSTGDHTKVRWTSSSNSADPQLLTGAGLNVPQEIQWDSDICDNTSGPVTIMIDKSHPGSSTHNPLSTMTAATFTIDKDQPSLTSFTTETGGEIGDTYNFSIAGQIDALANYTSSTETISYTTSDANVATVDATGMVTVTGGGTATITATWSDTSCHHPVIVTGIVAPADASLTLTGNVNETITKTTEFGDVEGPSSGADPSFTLTSTNVTGLTYHFSGGDLADWQIQLSPGPGWSTLPSSATSIPAGTAEDFFSNMKLRLGASASHTAGSKNLTMTIGCDQGLSDTLSVVGTIIAADVISFNFSSPSLTELNYEQSAGPSSSKSVQLLANNLYQSINVSLFGLNADMFEFSIDGGTTYHQGDPNQSLGSGGVNLTATEANADPTIHVRLVAGISGGTSVSAKLIASTDALNDNGGEVSNTECDVSGAVSIATVNAGEIVVVSPQPDPAPTGGTSPGNISFEDVSSFAESGQTTFQRSFQFYNQTDAARYGVSTYSDYTSNLGGAGTDAIVDTVTAITKVNLLVVGTTNYSNASSAMKNYNDTDRNIINLGVWQDHEVTFSEYSNNTATGYNIILSNINNEPHVVGVDFYQGVSDWAGPTTSCRYSVSVEYYVTSTTESDHQSLSGAIFTTERASTTTGPSSYTRHSWNTYNNSTTSDDTFVVVS